MSVNAPIALSPELAAVRTEALAIDLLRVFGGRTLLVKDVCDLYANWTNAQCKQAMHILESTGCAAVTLLSRQRRRSHGVPSLPNDAMITFGRRPE